MEKVLLSLKCGLLLKVVNCRLSSLICCSMMLLVGLGVFLF